MTSPTVSEPWTLLSVSGTSATAENVSCAERIASNEPHIRFQYYSDLVVIWTALLLALMGNTVVLLILWRCRQKKSRMQLLIAHLAVADMFVAIFHAVPEIWERMVCGFFVAKEFCRLVRYLQLVGTYGSTYVLLCAAYDRYRAIVDPMQSIQVSRKRIHVTVGIAWIVAGILAVPQTYMFTKVYVGKIELCWYNADNVTPIFQRAYVTWHFIMILVLPALLLTYCYGTIAVTISRNVRAKRHAEARNNRKVKETSTEKGYYAPRASSTASVVHAKRKTVIMTIVIAMAYIAFCAPFYVTQILIAYGIIEEDGSAQGIFSLLSYFNSCTNPWIYMCFSGNFLGDLKNFFCCNQKPSNGFMLQNRSNTNNKICNKTAGRDTERTLSTVLESPRFSQNHVVKTPKERHAMIGKVTDSSEAISENGLTSSLTLG